MNSNYLENSKNINLKDYEKTLIKRKKELEKLTKIYNRKLSKINEILNFNLENEKCKDEYPISLRYNKITEKNNNNEKMHNYTKKIIKKLKNRKDTFKTNVKTEPNITNETNELDINIYIPDIKEEETLIYKDFNIKNEKNKLKNNRNDYKINEQVSEFLNVQNNQETQIVKEEIEMPELEYVF